MRAVAPPDRQAPRLDHAWVRSQFPALAGDWIFMDNAGGSQILGSVVDRLRDYLVTSNVQLGASYAISSRAAERQREARGALAELLHAAPDEIVLGASTTVLLQLLARAIVPRWRAGDEVVVSRADHESNIGPWLALEAQGISVRFWEINRDTRALEPGDLDRLLTPRTRLVAVTHVSNILGAIVPIGDIAARAHACGAQVCVDGVAYAPHRAIDVQAWDVDYYVCSLYKTYGPHQALLYGKRDHLLALAGQYHYFIGDDDVPHKLEPGNANYELAHAAAGIPDYLAELGSRAGAAPDASRRERITVGFDAVTAHEARLSARLLDYLRDQPAIRLIGPDTADARRRVPTISFVVRNRDSAEIVAAIDEERIGIRYGDFHSRRLIEALDLADSNGVVRISLVHYNSIEEVDRLIVGLDRAL